MLSDEEGGVGDLSSSPGRGLPPSRQECRGGKEEGQGRVLSVPLSFLQKASGIPGTGPSCHRLDREAGSRTSVRSDRMSPDALPRQEWEKEALPLRLFDVVAYKIMSRRNGVERMINVKCQIPNEKKNG